MSNALAEKVVIVIVIFTVGMIAGVLVTPQNITDPREVTVEIEKPKNEVFTECYKQSVQLLGDRNTDGGMFYYDIKELNEERLRREVEYCVANYY